MVVVQKIKRYLVGVHIQLDAVAGFQNALVCLLGNIAAGPVISNCALRRRGASDDEVAGSILARCGCVSGRNKIPKRSCIR